MQSYRLFLSLTFLMLDILNLLIFMMIANILGFILSFYFYCLFIL